MSGPRALLAVLVLVVSVLVVSVLIAWTVLAAGNAQALGASRPATPAVAAAEARASAGQGIERLTVFRVDVSRYPQVDFVVTLPGAPHGLTGHRFSVTIGGRPVVASVRQLSPDDVELAVAPATGLPAAGFAAEGAAAARFLAGLPAGERTVAVDPATPGALPGALSADPAPAVAAIAALHRGAAGSAAGTLETALAAFTAGPRVRRTIILAVAAADSRLAAAPAARLRAWLAASGTSLYVLDATPGGAADYDALAAGSGGLAVPVLGRGGWGAAFAQVSASLGEQYYVRFTDHAPLPGPVRITARAGRGKLTGQASLPAANPVAPPLSIPAPPPPRTGAVPAEPAWDLSLGLLATALIATGVCYGMAMLAVSRREPRWPRRRRGGRIRGSLGGWHRRSAGPAAVRSPDAGAGTPQTAAAAADVLFFVFLMPCLNEEAVIANSLQRLLAMPGGDFIVLVIDDGSDDSTADVVAAMTEQAGGRVRLLRRRPPQARQGKGEALNAAVHYLLDAGHLDGRDPDRVIVVVVDADGRMDPDSVRAVTPIFADPEVGAVQIGVRINNRVTSTLARMQDMEFVIYTEVFQRGRRHLGSVGLGGNGQFMRLSAMLSLGRSPWTRSLTDDLDLGIRMIAAGWRNEYCSAVAVHQQGVVELRRLIRQRSRWFQGHLQSWRLIPLVLRKAPRRARTDLLYHLTSPAVLLIASLLSASFLTSVANAVLEAARGQNPAGWWIASTYALTFGPALAFSSVYWARERHEGVGAARTVALAHLYVCYGLMWYAAGWWAVGRTLRGQTGWAKTARVSESPLAASSTAPVATAPVATAPVATAPVASMAATSLPEPAPAIAGGKAGAEDGRRRSRRLTRRRILAVATAAALAGAVATAATTRLLGGGTRDPWVTVFTGYGSVSEAGSGPSLAVSLSPSTATSRATSHSALVVSAASYTDFAATVRVRTVRQLRRGRAGKPHAWEVGWVVWHYTSNERFYALTLEPTGWELSKQDPAYRGGERFLASGLRPAFEVGVPHNIGIVQVGNQITVSADGQVLTHFTDTANPYLSGAVGFYTEDAQAAFDQLRIAQLPEEGRLPMGHFPAAQDLTPGRSKPAIMVVYGTRPEAIKVAPLIRALDESGLFTVQVAVTAQHRAMLDQVNDVFGIKPEFDLDIHSQGQTLAEITTRALTGVHALLAEVRPDAVVVQGDTTTVFAAALAAFYQKIPVAHLEAGLRTGNAYSPYPEEINRQMATRLATLHLAPTATSRANLLAEQVAPASVVITGNTVIDALLWTVGQSSGLGEPRYGDPVLDQLDRDDAPVLLVTAHRRESWGEPLRAVGRAISRIAGLHPDVRIVLPLHRNPVVREAIMPEIAGLPNVIVTEPLPYAGFARLMSRATVILTDSGGVQEEGPSLGKPVLVMRDTTERPEAVSAGTVRLVGTGEDHIVAAVVHLLTDINAYASMASAVNPYGDGRAAGRAVAALVHFFRLGPPAEEFAGPSR